MSSRVTSVGFRINYDKKKFWDHTTTPEFNNEISRIYIYLWWLVYWYFAFIKFFIVFFTVYALNLSLFFECFVLRAQWHARRKNKFWNLRSTEHWIKKKQNKKIIKVRPSEKKLILIKRFDGKKVSMLNKVVKKIKKKISNKKLLYFVYKNVALKNKNVLSPSNVVSVAKKIFVRSARKYFTSTFKKSGILSSSLFKLSIIKFLTNKVRKMGSFGPVLNDEFRKKNSLSKKFFFYSTLRGLRHSDQRKKLTVFNSQVDFWIILKIFFWSVLPLFFLYLLNLKNLNLTAWSKNNAGSENVFECDLKLKPLVYDESFLCTNYSLLKEFEHKNKLKLVFSDIINKSCLRRKKQLKWQLGSLDAKFLRINNKPYDASSGNQTLSKKYTFLKDYDSLLKFSLKNAVLSKKHDEIQSKTFFGLQPFLNIDKKNKKYSIFDDDFYMSKYKFKETYSSSKNQYQKGGVVWKRGSSSHANKKEEVGENFVKSKLKKHLFYFDDALKIKKYDTLLFKSKSNLKRFFIKIARDTKAGVFKKNCRVVKKGITDFYRRKYQFEPNAYKPRSDIFSYLFYKKKINRRSKLNFLKMSKKLFLKISRFGSYNKKVFFFKRLFNSVDFNKRLNRKSFKENVAVYYGNNRYTKFKTDKKKFNLYEGRKNKIFQKICTDNTPGNNFKTVYAGASNAGRSALKTIERRFQGASSADFNRKYKKEGLKFRRFTSEFREFYFENELNYDRIIKKLIMERLWPPRALIGHINYYLKSVNKTLKNRDLAYFKKYFLKVGGRNGDESENSNLTTSTKWKNSEESLESFEKAVDEFDDYSLNEKNSKIYGPMYSPGYPYGFKSTSISARKIRLLFFNNQPESWNLFKKASFKAVFTRSDNQEKYALHLAKDWNFSCIHDIQNWDDTSRLYYLKATNLIYQRFNDTYSLKREFLCPVRLKSRVRYPAYLHSNGRFFRRYRALNQLPTLTIAYYCKAGGITITSVQSVEEGSTCYTVHPAEYFPTLDTGVLKKEKVNRYMGINFEDGIQDFNILPKFYLNGSKLVFTQKNAFYTNKTNLKTKRYTELYLNSQIAANNFLNRFTEKAHKFNEATISRFFNERLLTKIFLMKAGFVEKRLKKIFIKLKRKQLLKVKNNGSTFFSNNDGFIKGGASSRRRNFILKMKAKLWRRSRLKGRKKIFKFKRLNKVFLKYGKNFNYGFYKKNDSSLTSSAPSEYFFPSNSSFYTKWFSQTFNFGKIVFSEFYHEIISKNAKNFLFNENIFKKLNQDSYQNAVNVASLLKKNYDDTLASTAKFFLIKNQVDNLNTKIPVDFYLNSSYSVNSINYYKFLKKKFQIKSVFFSNPEFKQKTVKEYNSNENKHSSNSQLLNGKNNSIKVAQLAVYKGGFIPAKSDSFKKKPLKKLLKKIANWSKKEDSDKAWSEHFFLSKYEQWRVLTDKSIDAEKQPESKMWLVKNLNKKLTKKTNDQKTKNFFLGNAELLLKKKYNRSKNFEKVNFFFNTNQSSIISNYNNNKDRTQKKKINFKKVEASNINKNFTQVIKQNQDSRFFLNATSANFKRFALYFPFSYVLKKIYNFSDSIKTKGEDSLSTENFRSNIFSRIKKKSEFWYEAYIQKKSLGIFSSLKTSLKNIGSKKFSQKQKIHQQSIHEYRYLNGSLMKKNSKHLMLYKIFNFLKNKSIFGRNKTKSTSSAEFTNSPLFKNKFFYDSPFAIKKKFKNFFGFEFPKSYFLQTKNKVAALSNCSELLLSTNHKFSKPFYCNGLYSDFKSTINNMTFYPYFNKLKYLFSSLFLKDDGREDENNETEFYLEKNLKSDFIFKNNKLNKINDIFFEESYFNSILNIKQRFNKNFLEPLKNSALIQNGNYNNKYSVLYLKILGLFKSAVFKLAPLNLFFIKSFLISRILAIVSIFKTAYKKKKFFMFERFFTFYSSNKFSIIFKKFSYIIIYNIIGLILLVRSLDTFKFLEKWIIKYIFFPSKSIGLVRMLVLLFFSCSLLWYYQTFLIFLSFIFEKWRERKHFKLLSVIKTTIWSFPVVKKFLGFRLVISGKFNMKPRARSLQILKNFLPALQSMRFQVNYYYTMACNFFGAFGMHLWVYRRGGVYN